MRIFFVYIIKPLHNFLFDSCVDRFMKPLTLEIHHIVSLI